MIIRIPDSLDGKDRKRLILYYPILYSMLINHNRITKSAEWLGVTRRGLFDIIRKHHDLRSFLNQRANPDNGLLPPENTPCEAAPLQSVFNNHLARTQQSFWWNNATVEDKISCIERLKKLYLMLDLKE